MKSWIYTVVLAIVTSTPEPGDNHVSYWPSTSKGLGINVALGYRQNFGKQYYGYIDTYFITGAFQVGLKGGLGLRF